MSLPPADDSLISLQTLNGSAGHAEDSRAGHAWLHNPAAVPATLSNPSMDGLDQFAHYSDSIATATDYLLSGMILQQHLSVRKDGIHLQNGTILSNRIALS